MRLLFVNEKSPEDRTLICFIDEGMYDLCLDTGDEVIQVTDEVGFEKIREPNTKFLMRVVLTQKVKIRQKIFNIYMCPRCKKETRVEWRSTISIDWCALVIFGCNICC